MLGPAVGGVLASLSLVRDPEIDAKIAMVGFSSVTLRAFKLQLEDPCEDYGQVAVYRGTIPEHPHAFVLDDHHRFFAGKPMLVCGNTASMVRDTRYGQQFEVRGHQSVHFGLLDCVPSAAKAADGTSRGDSCC